MASVIWNEKERRWVMRVTINGHLRKFSSSKAGPSGKREVLDKFRVFSEGRGSAPLIVSDVWAEFIQYIINRNGRTDSFISLDKYGRNYILPRIGKLVIQSVNLLDLQDIISLSRPVSGKESLSKKTLQNLRASILQFVKYCVAMGYLEPLRGDLYIPRSAEKKEKVILQPSDIRRLFAGPSADDWYINIFRFGCCTGLRTGEILGIKTTDISDGVLTIQRSINVRNEITPGKNENARRMLYLNTFARRIINENIIRNRKLNTEWVFCSKSGGPLSQSTLRNNWIRIASERNLPGSPYSLRHTFVSLMKYEMPESMLKSVVGHSPSMDTLGTYGHLVSGDLQQAAQIIDVNFARLAGNDD